MIKDVTAKNGERCKHVEVTEHFNVYVGGLKTGRLQYAASIEGRLCSGAVSECGRMIPNADNGDFSEVEIAAIRCAIEAAREHESAAPALPSDVSTITEYGLTQRLSHAVRVF